MLKHSFLHIPTIGYKTESDLWSRNILNLKELSKVRNKRVIYDSAKESLYKLLEEDIGFFYKGLPTKEQWRVFKEFQHSVAYIDIETTGMSYNRDIITTIALYDGQNIFYYVHGKNLDDFKRDILNYKLIVTYNGKAFDIPYIENYFDISISHAHIDLRYILYSLGYKGGLKSCESQLGIQRDSALDGVDGSFAPFLWKYYKKYKDEKSLEILLHYNISDVLSLETLMVKAYNYNIDKLPTKFEKIIMPTRPKNPFKPNRLIINRIKKGLEKYGGTYLSKKQIKVDEKPKVITVQTEFFTLEEIEKRLTEEKPSTEFQTQWLFFQSDKKYPEPSSNSGKFLLFVSKEEIDDKWSFIKILMFGGELTKYAKVSTALRRKHTNKEEHVICIYTYDSTDQKDKSRVEKVLREFGFKGSIPYKLDSATRAGVYS